MKKYWLLKSEPETYGWEDLQKLGEDHWDGVRNYQARNFLKEMAVGDEAFFYHSGKSKEIVGVVRITSEAYADPTTADDRWVCVRVACAGKLSKPVTLEQIKQEASLQDMVLLKNSRLSVQPVTEEAFLYIIQLSHRS